MIFHSSFDLHFSINYSYLASFHVFFGHLYTFFGKMSILDLPTIFFYQIICFFGIELYELFVYLVTNP